MLAWLGTQRPDVLLLQELKGLEFPNESFEALGYRNAAVTQKTYNGVAILSLSPLDIISTTLPGDEEDSHARFLEAILDTPSGPLRVVDIYLPNGNPVGTPKFDYKLRWMDRLRARMRAWLESPTPTVIGGDFNVIPEDIDCHKPASWVRDALFQPETRASFRGLLDLGYIDAFRTLHPDEVGQFTYWDYFRDAFQTNRGVRIDHFLVSPALRDRLSACVIDKGPRAGEKPSDHTPVILTLS